MELKIALSTYIGGLAIFVIGIIIHPMIKIVRDAALEWLIYRIFSGKNTKDNITSFVHKNRAFMKNYKHDTEIQDRGGEEKYFINNKQVTKEQYQRYEEMQTLLSEQINVLETQIELQRRRADNMIRNFKIPIENPVTRILKITDEKINSPTRSSHKVTYIGGDLIRATDSVEAEKRTK